MNTVGKAVSVMSTVFILVLTCSVEKVVAQEISKKVQFPPLELLIKENSPYEHFENQATPILINKQTGLTLKEQPTQRGQHPKALGCVKATFKVEVDNVRDELKKGLFGKTKQYDSLIRFSKGKNNHDGKKDSFGMAIKVFDVDGEKILADEKTAKTQDFVLSSNEIFFVPNPFLLLKFKEAERAKKENLLDDPFRNFKVGDRKPFMNLDLDYQWFKIIVEHSHILPSNLLWQPYWSQTPYSLGTHKVKYLVRGTTESLKCDPGLGPDKSCKKPFFINDLRYFMQKDLDPTDETKTDVTFDFVIQEWPEGGHSGISEPPIEDPRFPWSTDGVSCKSCTKVATITISKQTFLSPGKMAFCEQMSFTPWHSLPEHKPLGGINRARKVVYQLGAKTRHVVNQAPGKEPTWPEYEAVKEYDEQLGNGSQGWSREEQGKFYHTAQGTALVPFPWFLALERMDLLGKAEVPFLDDANILRYGFLSDPGNRFGLPVGFTWGNYVDPQNRQTWVDITCAACHTGQLTYKGNIIRIDGAPSMQWNRPFLTALAGALKETLEEPEKFDRFEGEVRAIVRRLRLPVAREFFRDTHFMMSPDENLPGLGKHLLRSQVRQFMNELIRTKVTETKKNIFPTDWGHGRLDATGRGGNTVLVPLHHSNSEQASAPVSIPKIWDAWKYDWVQWNGSLTQPTGRNIAQAIGVGARTILENVVAVSEEDIDPFQSRSRQIDRFKKQNLFSRLPVAKKGTPGSFYLNTSIDLGKIVAIEQQLETLKPPSWPEKLFGEHNQKLAAEGKGLYKNHCKRCHVPKDFDPYKKHDYREEPYKIKFVEAEMIGTDPSTATNFKSRRVNPGKLKNLFKEEILPPAPILERITTDLREKLLDNHIKEIFCYKRDKDCMKRERIKEICESGADCTEINSIRQLLERSQEYNPAKIEKEITLIDKELRDIQDDKMGAVEKEIGVIPPEQLKRQEDHLARLQQDLKKEKEELDKIREDKNNTLNTIRTESEKLKGQIDGGCENLLLMDDGRREIDADAPFERVKPETPAEKEKRLEKKLRYNLCVFLALVGQDAGRKNEVRDQEVYIARTNAGVWATAPFLHNGSVPNLYQLLSPVSERSERFCLGKAEFDPKHVGVEVRTPPCIPFGESEFDTGISGNNNSGHEFREESEEEKTNGYNCHDREHRPNGVLGCEIKPKERFELIEYLKTSDCEFLTLDCTIDGAEKVLRTGTIVTKGEANWKEDRWGAVDDQTKPVFGASTHSQRKSADKTHFARTKLGAR